MHSTMLRIIIFCSLWLIANSYKCETYRQKSKFYVKKQRRVGYFWKNWETYHEYPTMYNYTICTHSTLEIGKQLKINNGKRENIKRILFKNSSLPVIPVGVFISFSNVTELYLNNSGVKLIHQGAFSGMLKLEKLFLQDNKIAVLERGILNYLSNLQILELSRNLLEDLELKSLFGLLALRELYLSSNILINQSFEEISNLQNLEILQLAVNNLTNFKPRGRFASLKQLSLNNNKLDNFSLNTFVNSSILKSIDLSFNYLTEINFNLFSKNIISLNINNNKLKNIESWIEIQERINVRHLYLSANHIQDLTSSIFKKLNNLYELDLSYNSIHVIDHDVFQNLNQLEKLYLNNNNITRLMIGCFRNLLNLKLLNISFNFISDLEYGTLAGMSALEELYLDSNKIAVLDENLFYVLKSLKVLSLSNNLLTHLTVSDLLDQLTYLKAINIQNNKWQCNELFKMVTVFKERFVETLQQFDNLRTSNVFGISCSNSNIEKAEISMKYREFQTSTFQNFSYCPNKHNGDVKQSRFYAFVNSNLYNLMTDALQHFSFSKYLDSKLFFNIFKNITQKWKADKDFKQSDLSDKRHHINRFTGRDKGLMKHIQTLSTRIIEFITVMITMSLIICVYLIMFTKPNVHST